MRTLGYITLWVPVTELNGFYSTNGYGPEGYYNAMGAYFGVKGVELFGQSELTTQAPNIEVRVRAGPAELSLSIDAGPMVESGVACSKISNLTCMITKQ